LVSQICGTTARLGIADKLDDGPRTVSELASLTSADPDGLGRLLRAAATVGLFTELEDDRFELTAPGGELRLGDNAGSLGDFAIALTAPGRWLPFGRLLDAVMSGQPQARQALGSDPWDYFASHADERWHFARAMGSISVEASAAVARQYDVSHFRRIVDVGGSQGVLLAGLLAAVPNSVSGSAYAIGCSGRGGWR
jgi:O-methyltransferase